MNKEEKYRLLTEQIRSLIEGERDVVAVMARRSEGQVIDLFCIQEWQQCRSCFWLPWPTSVSSTYSILLRRVIILCAAKIAQNFELSKYLSYLVCRTWFFGLLRLKGGACDTYREPCRIGVIENPKENDRKIGWNAIIVINKLIIKAISYGICLYEMPYKCHYHHKNMKLAYILTTIHRLFRAVNDRSLSQFK